MGEKKAIARVGIYGDLHLYSENYGSHRNYAEESLGFLRKITELTEKLQLTHLVGLGDFSFGNFRRLTYRTNVEAELYKQSRLVSGEHYEIFGNHDILAKDISERDYYISKGLLKPSENLTLGNLHITMVDYGKAANAETNISNAAGAVNVILAHDFFKFDGVPLANYGDAIRLDDKTEWFGADYIICGHIHKVIQFEGSIVKGAETHELSVQYPGCGMRPAFIKGHMDEKVLFIVFSVFDDGEVKEDIYSIDLPPLEESFNLEKISAEEKKEEEKPVSFDITDLVNNLQTHERVVGSPEEIIRALKDVPETWRNKALELLKSATS